MQYLCRKHNIDSLYPNDLKTQAKIEAFTHWQHLNLRFAGGGLFQTLVGVERNIYRPTCVPVHNAAELYLYIL